MLAEALRDPSLSLRAVELRAAIAAIVRKKPNAERLREWLGAWHMSSRSTERAPPKHLRHSGSISADRSTVSMHYAVTCEAVAVDVVFTLENKRLRAGMGALRFKGEPSLDAVQNLLAIGVSCVDLADAIAALINANKENGAAFLKNASRTPDSLHLGSSGARHTSLVCVFDEHQALVRCDVQRHFITLV